MKSKYISIGQVHSSMRMDGSYHNAEVNVYDNLLHSHSTHALKYFCKQIYTTGRGKRIYTTREKGIPFLSNSDVISQNPFMACNYMSRKYGFDKDSVLKSGMILTGRVGAIGQTAFVPDYWERLDAMGSDNIIRIWVKPEYKNGYIYAYLASKYGNLSFWKYATGGVQPFITDKMVGELPIPDFDDNLIDKIDSLIKEASKLREDSAILLDEAKELLEDYINVSFQLTCGFITSKRNIKEIKTSLQCRLDPPALINKSVLSFEKLKEKCVNLGSCQVKIYRPGIFKRNYVKDGIPYIKGSEIFCNNPFIKCEYLSKSKTPFIDLMKLKKNQILITCAGSVGQIKLITQEYEDKDAIGSQDIIRLESNDDLYTPEYLFTYLQIPLVYDYIQSMKYGSVIERIEPFHVESIPVITPSDEISKKITNIIKQYSDSIYMAFCKEENAINLVEKEIAKWK